MDRSVKGGKCMGIDMRFLLARRRCVIGSVDVSPAKTHFSGTALMLFSGSPRQ